MIYKIIPKSIIHIRLEHVIFLLFLVIVPQYIKRTYFSNFSFSGSFGINRLVIITIGVLISAVIIWFGYKYIEKIVYEVNSRITPLIWIFGLFLFVAVPLSFMGGESSQAGRKADNISQDVSQFNAGASSKRPNFIFIIMDTLAARDMQLYGYKRPTTPFISEWAKTAAVFNRAYAAANWTTPAAMSIMTGQRVWTHGVWHLIYYHPFENYDNNLPALLRDSGYDVYSFVQNPFAHPDTLGIKDPFLLRDKAHTFWLPPEWWMDILKGFFLNKPVVKEWIFERNVFAKKINSFRPESHVTDVPPDIVYNKFLKFISERQREKDKSQTPFFAWLHVFPPHDFYLPSEPYMGMFGDAEKYNSDKKQSEIEMLGSAYAPQLQPDVDILRKRYDEFVLYSDQQFKTFISGIAEKLDLSNTVIILLSDHGESFSHGWLAHKGTHLYESLVHVPLIIKLPGQAAGRTIDMKVEHTDVAPTILELAGISIPPWMEGRSLFPLLNGETMQSQPVFSMQFSNNPVIGSRHIDKGTVAVWDGDYKLINYLDNKKSLLFDLKNDPDENNDLYLSNPETAQRLLQLITDNIDRVNKRITH
ncbi:MAG: sulfatase [Thermodesulfovibrionia bacterium]|nr:sulfatase [Thermodesulfovibrionia bacterium]